MSKATLQIRRHADGMVVTHPGKWDADEYSWSEGNFGCDCNRADFFAQASGRPSNDHEACGEDRFSVRLTDGGGKVLYADGNWPVESTA